MRRVHLGANACFQHALCFFLHTILSSCDNRLLRVHTRMLRLELSFHHRQLTKDLSKFLVHLMGSSIFTSPPAKQTPVLDQAGLHHLVASGLIHIPLGVILLSELDCTFQVASVHDHGTTLFPVLMKLNMLFTDRAFLLSQVHPCASTSPQAGRLSWAAPFGCVGFDFSWTSLVVSLSYPKIFSSDGDDSKRPRMDALWKE